MAYIYDLTDTWNAGGTTFNAIKMNVTDSASAAGSKLVTLQTNGTEHFSVTKAGVGYFSGNVGIGTASPSSKLTVLNGDIEVNATGLGNTTLSYNGTTANLTVNSSSASLVLGTSSTERMRITSGGEVGIGLTPSHVLDVYSAANGIIRVGGGNATNQGAAYYVKSAGSSSTLAAFGDRARIFGGTPDQLVSIFTLASPLTFDVNGDEKVRISTAGSVGIGTNNPVAKLEVNGGIRASVGSGGELELYETNPTRANVFIAGANASGAFIDASYASGGSGALLLRTLGSERMRIDSSGNVGIGTSSPQLKLVVSNSGAAGLEISPDALASSPLIQSYNRSGAAYTQLGYNALQHVWQTSGTERARIDSSGNLLVGVAGHIFPTSGRTNIEVNGSSQSLFGMGVGGTSAAYFLHDGTNMDIWQSRNGYMRFGTNNTERARIDSSGNLLVGKTSAGGAAPGLELANNGAYGGKIDFYRIDNSNTQYHAEFRLTNGTTVGTISTTTTATSYNTSSDYRLKDIEGPITNSGAYIDALKPVQGSWKADGSRFIGLLAHEVQEVSETPIATGEKDGEEMQAMDYSAPEIIANLIAEIQSLRARVAQLEGN